MESNQCCKTFQHHTGGKRGEGEESEREREVKQILIHPPVRVLQSCKHLNNVSTFDILYNNQIKTLLNLHMGIQTKHYSMIQYSQLQQAQYTLQNDVGLLYSTIYWLR